MRLLRCSRPYHRKYSGGLEQFAADYEEAYTELAALGEVHSDQARRRRILTNLYDPDNVETSCWLATARDSVTPSRTLLTT